MSQPTLSQQLQKLEDEAGIILFDRTKQPILPTPEGERFLAQARVVLREHDKLIHLSKQTPDGKLRGEFRLGIIPTVASDLLPLFLQPFSTQFPEIELTIDEFKTETLLEELQADRLDGAILATPVSGSESLHVHPLYYEPFLAYFSPGHPLLKKTKIDRNSLDPKEMWLLQDGHCFKDQVIDYCARSSKKLGGAHPQFRSGSLDTLRKLVQAYQGYTLLPALMAEHLSKREQEAQIRAFENPAPTREVSLVYRRDHWKLALLKALETTLVAHLTPAVSETRNKNQTVLEVSQKTPSV